MGKCEQINKSIFPYMSDVISLIIHERHYASRVSYLDNMQQQYFLDQTGTNLKKYGY